MNSNPDNETQRVIGVFGGTFDPIHNTHIQIAQAALDQGAVSEVLFVVAARPPHKHNDVFATPQQRMEMVSIALETQCNMRPCSIELERSGPSYTTDTLKELRRLYPDAQLRLIVGLDALVDIPNWFEPEQILENAKLLAVSRPGIDVEIPGILEGHYQLLDFEETPLSSTRARRGITSGKDIEKYAPKVVADFIRKKGLYDVGS